MTFPEAVKSGFVNYVNFKGRASRSEFWFWALFVFIVLICAGVLDAVIVSEGEVGPLYIVANLVFLLPGIAVAVRRLHDRDQSGWWYLLVFVPLVGAIVLLVWFVLAGTVGANRFGPDSVARVPQADAPV